jgi:hypothetical protein
VNLNGIVAELTHLEDNNVTCDLMIQCKQTLVLEMSIGRDIGRQFLNVPVL